MSVEIKIIAADADLLAEQLLKVIKALGINAAAPPPREMGLDEMREKVATELAKQGFEMTITERPPVEELDPEVMQSFHDTFIAPKDVADAHAPKPAKAAKKPPAPSLDKETAAKQLKGGSPKSAGEAPPRPAKAGNGAEDAALEDKKFVENFLTTRYHDTTLPLAERAKASEFSLAEKARHNDVGLRQLPVSAFPAIRKRMEKEFGLA